MPSARPNSIRATILVVDDSPAMRRYLRTMLELDSYQVETAYNGSDALERLQRGCSPSVVVLDLQMPEMDGLQTLRRLRTCWPELKVIMCSGLDDPATEKQATGLGAQAYLTKPVRHLYLSAAVERCLSMKSAEEAGPRLLQLPPRGYREVR